MEKTEDDQDEPMEEIDIERIVNGGSAKSSKFKHMTFEALNSHAGELGSPKHKKTEKKTLKSSIVG